MTPSATPSRLITSVADVTPEWLTTVLRRSGALDRGAVKEIGVETGVTSFCTIARLRVSNTADASGPERLFLKFSLPDRPVTSLDLGAEVRFYRGVAARTPHVVVRCFDAEYSEEGRRLHILLEDMDETHLSEPPSQLPPTTENCYSIVEAIATVHAAWWNDPPWLVFGIDPPNEQAIEVRIADVTNRVERFAAFLGDRLSPERATMYRAVTASLPRLYVRLRDPLGYTVVHDDLHIGNLLYPRDPAVDSVRIIDWQTWHVDLSVKDLAHMMAVFWFPETRRRLELPLLRRYHECLESNGVRGYSWDNCWADYRLCVLRKLFHPAWQWDTGHHPNIWWNHLERVWNAFDDLGCAELV